MVDLDGAKDGTRKNGAVVQAVADIGLRVELGGGLRTMEDVRTVMAMGIYRAVIGSAAVSDPELVRQAVAGIWPRSDSHWGGRQRRPGVHRRMASGLRP